MRESNKLIAEFMDLRSTGLSIYKPSEYKYHTSWDWLMPVIDKCYQEHMSKHIADAVMTCNIDEVYQVVVNFIKEQNETKYKTCDKCSYDNLDDNGDILEHYCEDDELYTPNN